MCGENGKIIHRLNWKEFRHYQRWDEFPELKDNPPLTVDMSFWYQGKHYILAGEGNGVGIFKFEDYKRVLYDDNILTLLQKPFVNGKSFEQLINEISFDD